MEAAGLKGGSGSSILSTSNNSNYIDALGDEFLTEILFRLGCSQLATRCKCVSKRWCRLISSPFFIVGFLSHISKNPELGSSSGEEKSLKNQLPFSFLYECIGSSGLIKLFSQDPVSECNPGLSLDFFPRKLPSERDQNPKSELLHTEVVGASYDLVILEFLRSSSTMWSNAPDVNYLICNPRTMQWACLPPLPRQSMEISKVGFICKPYDPIDGQPTSREDRYQYGYRVVCIHGNDFTKPLQVEIFSSETQLWMQHVLSCRVEGNDNPIMSESVAYKGKLHWLTRENIVTFDPFHAPEGVIDCRLISWPTAPLFLGACLGVCRGYLRICVGHPPSSVKVCELKDYDNGEWSFTHNVSLSELEVPTIPYEQGLAQIELTLCLFRVVGFHPYNADIIYVKFLNLVFSCNLQSYVLEEVPEITSSASVYLLMLPRWPTPVLSPPTHGLL